MRAGRTATVLLGLAWSLVGSTSAGQDRPPEAPAEPDRAAAVERGVAALINMQESLAEAKQPNEWPYEGVYRVRGEGGRGRVIPLGYRVGGTAITAWAMCAAPGWKGDSKRRKTVERGLDFILAQLDEPGMAADFVGSYDVRGWGQAYALSFLCQLKSQDRVPQKRRRAVDDAITSLARTLQATEIVTSGGWNYSRPGRKQRPSAASTFMTSSVLQALFAAADLGENLDAAVIERALATLRTARLKSGAFQYGSDPEHATGRGFEAIPGAIGRMPICETTLLLAGEGDQKHLTLAVDAFLEEWQALEDRRAEDGTHEPPYMVAPYYFCYAHLYAAQAIELLPQEVRDAYRERFRERLFSVMETDGTWNDRVFERSANFGTATAVLALLQPKLAAPAGWSPPPSAPK
ncbi:MAG: hypothetical protein CMK00_09105 [Planctomycetes bacterium]|nr:hypothetical protein [Planctomycetota bacterium]